MGQLVEVLSVEIGEVGPSELLLGASIDVPTAGSKVASQTVEIGGWALGRAQTPDGVEAVQGGTVLGRAAVWLPRPDIAEAFPDCSEARRAGFEIAIDTSNAPPRADVELRARFGQAAVPIGSFRLRRLWRGEARSGELQLVSVIIALEGGSEGLDLTLRSLATQRYGPTELLIVHPDSLDPASFETWCQLGVRSIASPDHGPAGLRNEGIRRSNGQLLTFLKAGSVFAATALGRGTELLGRRHEAAGVVDGVEGHGVAAAMIRRSAFEELRGFNERAHRDCDLELAQRAVVFGVLFRAGSLIVAGET